MIEFVVVAALPSNVGNRDDSAFWPLLIPFSTVVFWVVVLSGLLVRGCRLFCLERAMTSAYRGEGRASRGVQA